VEENDYLTIPQLAEILGISRIAIYKKVKKGQIKAIRIGRNYAISRNYIAEILGDSLSEAQKKRIDKAISRTVKEYGEVLKLLGRE
jgi:excisionase family DNA binding protein